MELSLLSNGRDAEPSRESRKLRRERYGRKWSNAPLSNDKPRSLCAEPAYARIVRVQAPGSSKRLRGAFFELAAPACVGFAYAPDDFVLAGRRGLAQHLRVDGTE